MDAARIVAPAGWRRRSFTDALAIVVCALTPVLTQCGGGANDSPDAAATSGSDHGASGTSNPSLGADATTGSSGGGGGTQSGGGGSASPEASGDDAGAGQAPPSGDDGSCPATSEYPQTSFVSLAVTLGPKLDPSENDAIPSSNAADGGDADAGTAKTAPAGWNFYGKDGALCRDGSPAGFYVHYAQSDKLFIYLEGGGACDNVSFCNHNPANITSVFPGGAPTQGQSILGSLVVVPGLQAPYVPTPAHGSTAAYSPGIFDFTNSANPFKDWNGVYVPYCTGDVHFGTADNVDIPTDGVHPALSNQHFVGHLNLQKFIARIVPTFPNMSQVVLTGTSAGGFGAGLNYGMVQDSFGTSVPVVVLDDSGPPFSEQYFPACLQKAWRSVWGFDAALPSDCKECFESDGSGLTNVVYYWLRKYPNVSFGLVSTMQDAVIRLFFAQGNNNCSSQNATWDGLVQILGAGTTGTSYIAGLDDLQSTFQCTGHFGGYLIGGKNPDYEHPTFHQHIFRDEFYEAITNDGGITMAQWTSDLIGGKVEIVGP
jgi:hypothetical protein